MLELSPKQLDCSGTTPCHFKVYRKRKNTKVVAVSLFKKSVGYLNNFEAAAPSWIEIIKRHYGDDWGLRIYTDQSAVGRIEETSSYSREGWLGGAREDGEECDNTVTVSDSQKLYKIFLCMARNHPSIEIWHVTCPTFLVQRRTSADANMPGTHRSTFISSLRFHPLFDPDIDVAVVRNFELLSSERDAKEVKAWIQQPNKMYLTYTQQKTYNGGYASCGSHPEKKKTANWAYEGASSCNCYSYGKNVEKGMKVIENSFHVGDDGKVQRVALLAGFFAAKRNPGSEHSILPLYIWSLMMEVAYACGFGEGGYGVDEIALMYSLKYLPLAHKEQQKHAGYIGTKEWLQEALKGPVLFTKVLDFYDFAGEEYLQDNAYAITAENTRAVPITWRVDGIMSLILGIDSGKGLLAIDESEGFISGEHVKLDGYEILLRGQDFYIGLRDSLVDKMDDIAHNLCDVTCEHFKRLTVSFFRKRQVLPECKHIELEPITESSAIFTAFQEVWHILTVVTERCLYVQKRYLIK